MINKVVSRFLNEMFKGQWVVSIRQETFKKTIAYRRVILSIHSTIDIKIPDIIIEDTSLESFELLEEKAYTQLLKIIYIVIQTLNLVHDNSVMTELDLKDLPNNWTPEDFLHLRRILYALERRGLNSITDDTSK